MPTILDAIALALKEARPKHLSVRRQPDEDIEDWAKRLHRKYRISVHTVTIPKPLSHPTSGVHPRSDHA